MSTAVNEGQLEARDIERRVIATVRGVLETHSPSTAAKEIRASSRLSRDLGIDSLGILHLIVGLEEEFDQKASGFLPGDLKTVGDVVKRIVNAKAVRSDPADRHLAAAAVASDVLLHDEFAELMKSGGTGKRLLRRSLRLFFSILLRVKRTTAISAVRILIATPNRSRSSRWEMDLAQQAEIGTVDVLGEPATYYRWGTGPRKVLLSHGWGGRGTQMGQLIAPLQALGFSVVAFDAPGHGRSARATSTLSHFVLTISALEQKFGPFNHAIGHCFGALALLAAHSLKNIDPEKMVVVSCFKSGSWLRDLFARSLGLPTEVVDEALRQDFIGPEVELQSTNAIKIVGNSRVPVLVVHDLDDPSIPFSHAEAIVNASKIAKAFTTSALGHRHIIAHPPVVTAIVQFISDQDQAGFSAPLRKERTV